MDFICHPAFQKENISDSKSVSSLRRSSRISEKIESEM
jgi:hypothetical protein